MDARLDFRISPQPDMTTCGPTCLHAIYRFWGDRIGLDRVVSEVRTLKDGGTLAVLLGCHALRRGYDARIYTCNLQVFDPTWFEGKPVGLREKLLEQRRHKNKRKLRVATDAFVEYLDLGGEIRFEDLSRRRLRAPLERGIPILTGLSATWLYRCSREVGDPPEYDDIRGLSQGHFVVVCGYDREKRSVLVADPLLPNPVSPEHIYEVGMDRLISAILLGVLTYDANLLMITPGKKPGKSKHVDPDRR